MNQLDAEKRDALAEALSEFGHLGNRQRAADAVAPLIAGWLRETARAEAALWRARIEDRSQLIEWAREDAREDERGRLADEAWGRATEARSDVPSSWRDVARWLRGGES